MTQKTVLAIVAVLVLGGVVFAVSAYAQMSCCPMDARETWPYAPEKFRLTEKQQLAIDAVHARYDDKLLPLVQELSSKRLELEAYLSRADAEVGKINAYRKEIRAIGGKTDDLRADAQTEIDKILTKEQRDYWDDISSLWGLGYKGHDDCPMMGGYRGWRLDPMGGSSRGMEWYRDGWCD